ncbi:MAG: alanine--tRNA ligase [Clostridia bacterium]|nr:alanine--tRNA ligase [Clostridia bacterium]
MKLTSVELRKKWIEFFRERGHTPISSASLIPENDPTVLFTTAGMHPLVPYLLGQPHPEGKRLCDAQKCVRTGDIDDVGDSSHCTFFEMLGNWSLGDYFKKEMVPWSYEFLTEVLKIAPDRLAVTVFEGDADCPRDDETAELWHKCGIKKENIFYLGKKHNWWGPAGQTGPCGPDTEMFFDTGKPKCCDACSPACDCGKYVEIWNDVFMQFNKNADGSFSPLKQKNVDTGMGLERVLMNVHGLKSVYDTDVFVPIVDGIKSRADSRVTDAPTDEDIRAVRVVADHIRTSTFILGDERGVVPSNVDQGYILRRLLRRAIRFGTTVGLKKGDYSQIADIVVGLYKDVYPELDAARDKIKSEIDAEEERFTKTLENGIKEFEKLCRFLQDKVIPGKSAFRLYDTYGFPLEMTVEMARERGFTVDVEGFEKKFEEHKNLSHAGAEQRFKGGLADTGELTARLHTATHLLHRALKTVLNDESVNQRGSNITPERLRFDFSFGRAMTPEEVKAVEDKVNAAIAADVPVVCEEMTVEQAKAAGAVGLFTSKYGEKVKVYTMGEFSKEICGGPHAARTGELGHFRIVKEQSSSAGVRRIKAVLE